MREGQFMTGEGQTVSGEGRREVMREAELLLKIHVQCGEAVLVEGHTKDILMIPFSGKAEGPYFTDSGRRNGCPEGGERREKDSLRQICAGGSGLYGTKMPYIYRESGMSGRNIPSFHRYGQSGAGRMGGGRIVGYRGGNSGRRLRQDI